MEPEREGNVQQISKKIDNIWEQASDLANRMSSVMEFLRGSQPATPCAKETPIQMGWLGRTNDRLENIIAVLDECVVIANHLRDEGFISNATQERYDVTDQKRLEEIQRKMQEPSSQNDYSGG